MLVVIYPDTSSGRFKVEIRGAGYVDEFSEVGVVCIDGACSYAADMKNTVKLFIEARRVSLVLKTDENGETVRIIFINTE